MNYEERNSNNSGYQRFRSTLHIGMGIFYICMGLLIIYVKYFGAMALPDTFAYILGGLMIAYGIFRIWRGYMDMKHIPKRDLRREFPSLNLDDDKE
jgi:sulfite exporter TauE/SafE